MAVTIADEVIGKNLDGRYLIRERIGAGGMGVVYRGRQVSIGRDVAIKLVQPSMLGDRNAARRFLREVSLAARLTSPHTVQVIDFGETPEGTLYLVMEMLTGEGLDAELRRTGRLPPRRVIDLAIPITDALAAAHASSVVHRDLKPSNVFLAREPSGPERVKVLDFGIARGFGDSSLTGSGEVVGSPPYVAPEAIRGEPLDGRADLYALGCMMFQLVSGSPPFLATSVAETFQLHLHEPVPPLPADTPPALAAIVARLLAKAPADRFAGAAEVRAALTSALREIEDDPRAIVPAPSRDATTRRDELEVSMTAASAETRIVRGGRADEPSDRRPDEETERRRTVSPMLLGAIVFVGALGVAALAWTLSRRDEPGANPLPQDGATTNGAGPTLDAATTGVSVDTPIVDAGLVDAAQVDTALVDASDDNGIVDAAPRAADARTRGSSSRPRDAGVREPRPATDAAPQPTARRDAGVGFVLPR